MIALVKWRPGAVREAISLCRGLDRLAPGARVLIKPNLPVGGVFLGRFPGVYTSPEVVEEIVQALCERAITDITIGEGTVLLPALDSNTATALQYAGYAPLKTRYGVKFADFNEGDWVDHHLAGHSISIARSALEHDFLVNVPVLKTHRQTRVTLGMKNLKGLLSMRSKQDFHRHGLDALIAALNGVVRSDLVVVDGRFALEYGPTGDLRKQANLVIAGTDVLEVDRAGSEILGIDPREVGHLVRYAASTGRSMDVPVDVRGETVAAMQVPCRWQVSEETYIAAECRASGLRIPTDDSTSICSMCEFALAYGFYAVEQAFGAVDFGGLAILMGRKAHRPAECGKTALFGTCAIQTAGHREGALAIEGCPPDLHEVVRALSDLAGFTREP